MIHDSRFAFGRHGEMVVVLNKNEMHLRKEYESVGFKVIENQDVLDGSKTS